MRPCVCGNTSIWWEAAPRWEGEDFFVGVLLECSRCRRRTAAFEHEAEAVAAWESGSVVERDRGPGPV